MTSPHITLGDWLTTKQLARRWALAEKTLINWRYEGRGPEFYKWGWTVIYPITAVRAYEKLNGLPK